MVNLSNAYAEGARIGAPLAIQIADRFHLLANLSDFLQRLVERHRQELKVEVAVVAEVAPAAPFQPTQDNRRTYTGRARLSSRPPSQLRAHADLRRQHRAERYDQIRQLHQQGFSIRRIMNELQVARSTIRRALSTTGCPEHGSHQRRIKPFIPYLTERCQRGERNAHRLFLEIQAQGYPGSYFAVTRFVAQYRQPDLPPPTPEPPTALSPVTPPALVTRIMRLTLSTR